ncbi:4Fe-4S binding protein [Desulfovibrio inopinatus]|uniref:4Fe-4S binding protein n=1 Tax=Desulfovibrio inopinatus TaxID=102109 RepID=UPI0003FD4CAA|nr:4Fe-4S binding protein [Desulfovibrio inopinatus]
MATTTKLAVQDNNPISAIREFLKTILADESVSAIFTPVAQRGSGAVMPALVTDPTVLDQADPLAPAFPLNAARLISRLTRGESSRQDGLIVAVLRPCEIRAFIELVKLNQGNLDSLILIGADCYGAYTNIDYPIFAHNKTGDDATLEFLHSLGAGSDSAKEVGLAKACQACEHPSPKEADLAIELVGADIFSSIPVAAKTARGEGLLNRLGMVDTGETSARQQALEELIARRIAYRDVLFAETAEATSDLHKLNGYLSDCINCYNCRVACPVCYCRECVFVTDVFEHQPWQYLSWARDSGAIKMPTDTIFYHLTRLAHMSTACVGCGQCSNACPNDVPVMQLFRMVAAETQEVFGYEPGRSVGDAPPLTVFHEKEFPELTGGVD